nr:hypothetical protein [Dyella soli]
MGIAVVGMLRMTGTEQASLDVALIYFPHGRPGPTDGPADLESYLDADSRQNLHRVLQGFKEQPILGGEVQGFADSRECGSPVECQEVSYRRAKAVYDWMLLNGLPPWQLRGPSGFATEYAVAQDESEPQLRLNRRVSFAPFFVDEKR